MKNREDYRLFYNSRFYIFVFSTLLSLGVFAWLRIQIPTDGLFYIRVQQVFGLISLLYWYFALIISPIGHVVGKQRVSHLTFARRAIGVSAFYFALLHAVIAIWGQLGGLHTILLLPALFKWSLLAGVIALTILAVMAATSLDKAISFMTYRWWKWLHRLVYAGGVLAILHIWSIGTHLAYSGVQVAAFIALALLSGLELITIFKLLNRTRFRIGNPELLSLFLTTWVLVCILLLFIPVTIQNYHTVHTDHATTMPKPSHSRDAQ